MGYPVHLLGTRLLSIRHSEMASIEVIILSKGRSSRILLRVRLESFGLVEAVGVGKCWKGDLLVSEISTS